MATPAFLRYLPARLKPLSAPAVWAPLTVFTLLSIFIWEYHKNPDWFNRPQIDTLNPESTLTPEEEARLSEIDTLELLLRNVRAPGGEDTSQSLISPADADATSEEVISPDRTLAGRDNPFADYKEQYKFPGSQEAGTEGSQGFSATQRLRGGTAASSLGSLGTFQPGTSQPGTLQTGTSQAATSSGSSALSEALNRQQAARNSTRDRAVEGSSTSGRLPVSTGSIRADEDASTGTQFLERSPNRSANLSGTASGLSTNAGNADSALPFSAPTSGNSGISVPFIRTTTDMSPPVGTTGYQVPASTALPVFNMPPQQPTRNPFQRANPFQRDTGTIAPVVPAAAAPAPTPTVNYTAPSFVQPEQNSRR